MRSRTASSSSTRRSRRPPADAQVSCRGRRIGYGTRLGGGRSAAALTPVLGDVGVFEEDDVIVGARRCDRVPDAGQRRFLVVRVEFDLEDADVVGLGGLGAGKLLQELRASLLVAGRP